MSSLKRRLPRKKKKVFECLLCREPFELPNYRAQLYATKFVLCPTCFEWLREKYYIRYRRRNGGYTKLEAHLRLLSAVRETAVLDKKLDDFELYWIRSLKWSAVWDTLRDKMQKTNQLDDVVNSFFTK